jgi:hypothetical protein
MEVLKMYDEMSYGSKLYVIPQDEETRRDLLNVDRNTKEDLRNKHRLHVNVDWESNTIANTTIEVLIRVLYANIKENGVSVLNVDDNGMLNFYDLIELAATNKINESAEKNGNINVKFYPGELVDGIIADDVAREDKQYEYISSEAAYSYPDDIDRTNAMLKIDKLARKTLADKYSIMLPKDYMAVATTCVLVENIYRELIQKIVLTNKPAVTINFNDLIEFHAIRKKEGVDIKLRPGMGAKLIIKSDESTEADDDGYDD